MQIETLQLYTDIVRLGSYSEAAREHDISQSAASQAIARLEHELGAQLIDRSCRPFVVTPAGRRLHEAALGLVASWEQAKADVAEARTRIEGVVRLAAIYSIGVHDVRRYVESFRATYPAARVELDCLHPDEVVDAVLGGVADLGILSYPPRDRDLVVIELRPEPMVLVCGPEHRLARRRTVRVDELAGESFVAFEETLPIRKSISRALRHHGVAVDVVLEFDNVETIKQAILTGAGVSILPQGTVDAEARRGTLVARPIAPPEFVRPLGIILARHRTKSPAVERFVQLVQDTPPRVGTAARGSRIAR